METIQRQIRKVGEALEITQPGRTWTLEPTDESYAGALELYQMEASSRPFNDSGLNRAWWSAVTTRVLVLMGWCADRVVAPHGTLIVEPAGETGYWLGSLLRRPAGPMTQWYFRGPTERPTEWPAEAWEQLGRDLESKAMVEAHYGSPN